MSQLNKWMIGQKISRLAIVITSKETGEHVERWQFDVCPCLAQKTETVTDKLGPTQQDSLQVIEEVRGQREFTTVVKPLSHDCKAHANKMQVVPPKYQSRSLQQKKKSNPQSEHLSDKSQLR